MLKTKTYNIEAEVKAVQFTGAPGAEKVLRWIAKNNPTHRARLVTSPEGVAVIEVFPPRMGFVDAFAGSWFVSFGPTTLSIFTDHDFRALFKENDR